MPALFRGLGHRLHSRLPPQRARQALKPPGLTSAGAAERLAAEGPNCLPARQSRGTAAIAAEVVREPMLLLLFAAAGVYLSLIELHEGLEIAASNVLGLPLT